MGTHLSYSDTVRSRINDVNKRDPEGNTVLLNAVSAGNLEATELFLSNGADANAKNKLGISALHLAVGRCHEEIVALLLLHKAEPNVQNNRGNTPSHDAAELGQLNVLLMLHKHGANWSITNDMGSDVLSIAETSELRDSAKRSQFLVSVRAVMSGQRKDQWMAAAWPPEGLLSKSAPTDEPHDDDRRQSSDIFKSSSLFEQTHVEFVGQWEKMPLLWKSDFSEEDSTATVESDIAFSLAVHRSVSIALFPIMQQE